MTYPHEPRVVTSYDPPPIPYRTMDWSAWDDKLGADSSPIGRGATEAEAIADFYDQWLEEYGTTFT